MPSQISTRSSHAIPVNLGSAEDYTILGETGVSTVPESQVQGNIGVSPIAATGLTGFALTLDSTGVFCTPLFRSRFLYGKVHRAFSCSSIIIATSTQVSGKLYAANYVVPTPTNLISAMSDMKTARTSAAGQIPADFVDFESGILGSSVLVAGIYNFNTAVHIPGSLTLNGAATDVFVFQIAYVVTLRPRCLGYLLKYLGFFLQWHS